MKFLPKYRLLSILAGCLLSVSLMAQNTRETAQRRDFIDRENFVPQFETLRFNKEKQKTGIFISAVDTNEVQRFKDALKECEAVVKSNAHVYVILLPEESRTLAFIKTVEQILQSYDLQGVTLMILDNKSLATDLIIHLQADGIKTAPEIFPAAASDDLCALIDSKLKELEEKELIRIQQETRE